MHDNDDDNDDDAKAIAIPRVFSENSRAKNDEHWRLKLFLGQF